MWSLWVQGPGSCVACDDQWKSNRHGSSLFLPNLSGFLAVQGRTLDREIRDGRNSDVTLFVSYSLLFFVTDEQQLVEFLSMHVSCNAEPFITLLSRFLSSYFGTICSNTKWMCNVSQLLYGFVQTSQAQYSIFYQLHCTAPIVSSLFSNSSVQCEWR